MGSDVEANTGADPEITVIVVNFNGGDWIARCMASLARQTHQNFETILVDNASSDGSLFSARARIMDLRRATISPPASQRDNGLPFSIPTPRPPLTG
jgi:GT2 family glycosyltransferase